MKSIKKIFVVLLAFAMVLSLAACGDSGNKPNEGGSEGAKKIGLLIYNGSDNYIATVRQAFEKMDKENDAYELEIVDGQKNQATQNEQLDALISKKVDALLVNIVDFGAAKEVMAKIKDSKIPTVFWNRDVTSDLTEADLEQFIFFGTVAPQAGVFQGEMALDYWNNNKDKADRNKNGKLEYVMLHGGLDNAEAVARTEESVKVLKEAGLDVVELGMQVADWSTDKAKTAVDAWLAKDKDNIDVIFANNDGMASGAVSALKAIGFNSGDEGKYIPVYGVDALDLALDHIKAGEMAGTVKQNSETMAKGVMDLILNKLDGKNWTEGTEHEIYEDKVSVRMDYEKVTQ
ncbi:MAG: galactose ABC transporter substrate-binding protein [Tissierellia bacterium]|nr:galactose ABC transporter substrate-binding protein [Tissierellia bacterium]